MKTSFILIAKLQLPVMHNHPSPGSFYSCTLKTTIMTSNEILKADMLDILFDNRNKQYGAYALRKNYNHRLSIALGISLSTVFLLFILMPAKSFRTHFSINDHNIVQLKTIELPRPEKKRIPPPQPKAQVQQFKQRQFTNIIMVNKEKVLPPPDVRELETSLISTKTTDGPLYNGIPIVKEVVETAKEEPQKKSEMKPDQQPEFPGGQEAWLNFLRKNLIAPEELEAGEKKTVSIRFDVSEEGFVTNFQIVQSAGTIYDNEVIRVLKKMPKWKPAIQNGQPVSKAFTQPVTFMGVEQ